MQKSLKVTRSFVKKCLPKRTNDSHKGESGDVLIVGGGKGLYGAGLLAALAATRTGAGYTHLMTDLSRFPWLKFPDFIVYPLTLMDLKLILKKKSSAVIGIGPGLGINVRSQNLLKELMKHNELNVVIDADALTILAKMKMENSKLVLPAHWILCPHEGEMARLMNVKSLSVKKNRIKILLAAQAAYGCVVMLKGSETLIADKYQIAHITAGSSALAKAGTGDVLLGMICSLLAQGLKGLPAAATACFLHGTAGKIWTSEGRDYLSLRPLDLIEMLPKAIHVLRSRP